MRTLSRIDLNKYYWRLQLEFNYAIRKRSSTLHQVRVTFKESFDGRLKCFILGAVFNFPEIPEAYWVFWSRRLHILG